MKNFVAVLMALAILGAGCGGESSTNLVEFSDPETPTATDESPSPETNDVAAPTSEPLVAAGAPATSGADDSAAAPAPTAAPTSTPIAGSGNRDVTPEPEPTIEPEPFDEEASVERAEAVLADATDWCSATLLLTENFDSLATVDVADPEAFETAYRDAQQVLVQAQALVPEAIAADLDVSLQGFGLLVEELDNVEWEFQNLPPSAGGDLDGRVTEANFNIDTYQFEVCGIGEAPVDPADGTPPVRPDGPGADQAVAALVAAGFTPEEAQCLNENIDFFDPAVVATPEAMFAALSECGIAIDRMAQLGS